MGCTSSKSKNYPQAPETGRYNEPNYTDLTRNVDNGGFSSHSQPQRRAPAQQPQRNGRANLGASTAGSRADSDNCFPELVKFRLDESEVLLTRKVSSGAFGVVWLGHYHGQPVAVKRMIDGEDEAVSFSREIETMSKLSHPKIVRFIGCTWTNKKDLGGVSEYMDGGDVRTLLETRKIDLSWKKEKISIAIDIAEALAYMHSRSPKIIHRDLKSRNVLLNTSMVAKLSDFGLSRNRTYEETLTAGVGTFDPALRPDSESVVQMLNDARVQLQAMS
ncbi:hypothetical protein PHYBOEH_003665 [Phytophthora boehmeriae]|uniref:Protein kinase domain-containing protein n=1 Tax=Phytophthora boehmeriae TaxID=109152 RepID=A0A8T1WQ02_9STRA|nr:hypothetical protein PHYBOEH_003665 [Phytophthora boehmeriae]